MVRDIGKLITVKCITNLVIPRAHGNIVMSSVSILVNALFLYRDDGVPLINMALIENIRKDRQIFT